MEADLVLIQEPRKEKLKDSTRLHPSFTFIKGAEQDPAKCWIAVNWASRCRVMELKDLTKDYGNTMYKSLRLHHRVNQQS
jgi:hypothetical protein